MDGCLALELTRAFQAMKPDNPAHKTYRANRRNGTFAQDVEQGNDGALRLMSRDVDGSF